MLMLVWILILVVLLLCYRLLFWVGFVVLRKVSIVVVWVGGFRIFPVEAHWLFVCCFVALWFLCVLLSRWLTFCNLIYWLVNPGWNVVFTLNRMEHFLEKRHSFQLHYGVPLVLFYLETFQHGLFYLAGELIFQAAATYRNWNGVFELALGSAMGEGSFPMQEFKHHYAERPYISLRAIYVINQALWRHVNRRTDVNVLEFGSRLNRWVTW